MASRENTWHIEAILLNGLGKDDVASVQLREGEKHPEPVKPADLSGRSVEYLRAILEDLDHRHYEMLVCEEVIAEALPVLGELGIADAPARDLVEIDPEAWRSAFRLHYANWRSFFINILPKADHDDLIDRLDHLADSAAALDFDFSAAEWSRFLVAFVKAYRWASPEERKTIPEMMLPVLQARAISFYHELGGRSVAEMCGVLRDQAARVLAERDRQLVHEKTAAALRQRFLTPIRKTIEAEFLRLASALIERARAREQTAESYSTLADTFSQQAHTGGQADAFYSKLADWMAQRSRQLDEPGEADRLIDNARAMHQQWVPLAVYDELTAAWAREISPLTTQFLRRYNLFVTREMPRRNPARWRQLSRIYQRLAALGPSTTQLAQQKQAVIEPLLATAKEDNPETGQFKQLPEADFNRYLEMYRQLEKSVEQFHVTVLEGLAMQQAWMDEYGYDEPGEEMDVKEPLSQLE